jgi:hypothetical protein
MAGNICLVARTLAGTFHRGGFESGRVGEQASDFLPDDQSFAGYASAARRNIAVQSPASKPAARIHSKREMRQIGLPVAHRQRPSKQPATHEVFGLASEEITDENENPPIDGRLQAKKLENARGMASFALKVGSEICRNFSKMRHEIASIGSRFRMKTHFSPRAVAV